MAASALAAGAALAAAGSVGRGQRCEDPKPWARTHDHGLEVGVFELRIELLLEAFAVCERRQDFLECSALVEGEIDDIRNLYYAIAITRHPWCDEDSEHHETSRQINQGQN